MHYSDFALKFEKIARLQTRSLSIRNNEDIPDGDYAFLPLFCNDKKCDCRRTMLNVLQVSPEFGVFHAATLSYGWEPLSFYREWSVGMSDSVLAEFKGPSLGRMNTQSPYAGALLGIFEEVVLDENYSKRLQRQYAMYKYKQGMKLAPEILSLLRLYEPCPCESGATFKNCCGKTSSFTRRFSGK